MSAYSDMVLATAGLRHYWKMGESVGSAADSGPGALSGTIGAGVQRGREGAIRTDPAARFLKANASTSKMTWTPIAAFTGAFTVELIFRALVTPINGHFILGTRGNANNTGSFEIIWNSNNALGTNHGNGSAWSSTALASPVLLPDWWYHVMCTEGGDGSAEMFVNGASVSSLSAAAWSCGGVPMLWDTSAHVPVLGDYDRTADANWAADGYIHQVAVYDRKLTAFDAAAHYGAMIGRGPVAGQTWPRWGA